MLREVDMRLVPALLLMVSPCGAADDFDDAPAYAHAMEIRTEEIDGFPVVTQHGRIRPDFSDRAPNPHRQRQRLDGKWHFRFDPENVGLKEGWATGEDLSGWSPVQVPHCWDMMPGGRFWDWSDRSHRNPPFYDGVAWYRRSFEAGEAEGKARRLEFLGLSHRVTVFLNGKELVRHEGGGQPFSIDVTEALKTGGNTLAVRIVRLPNFREKTDGDGFEEIEYVHGRHPKAPDNWPYAGIPRSVSLVTEDPAAIRKVQLRPSGATLKLAVCLSNRGSAARTMEVAPMSEVLTGIGPRTVTLKPGERRVLRFSAKAKPATPRWSPTNPALHRLTVTASADGGVFDEMRVAFGLRDFRIRGEQFVLNGEPVFLKGVAFYEEHPTRGHALTRADHEGLFKRAGQAGANFVRLHVAQRHPWTYELADRSGMMVCAEWGGFWYREKAMEAQTRDERSIFQSLARCALWDLMNHPSVVMWGTNNECHQFCDEYEPFVEMNHRLVDAHDWQQRPVTWAAWHPHQGQPHFEHADAVGFNEYRGAMDPFEELDPDMKRVAEENPGKPLIIMENGGWSKLGDRGPRDRKGTEDWQADLLRRQHEVLTRHLPPLAGYTYWLLADYRSRKTYTGNQGSDGWSRMGLYTPEGKAKMVRDVFRDLEW